ncbi:MAG: hypothetical protein LUH49_09310 [Cloacibacillus porcorum]|uniref:Na+/H+ antiporter NhaC family protein n=1 Tax=Cloacibacillus porcorum TaxID=1197717 RepID=UPI0023F4B00B|nr:Na+/H+ antiporter NhaC family protein [Cloacibacillus porcorum]MCD7877138.1 hypothetical protein [Cloacibacillus porcorum]
MGEIAPKGIISLIPVFITLILAFKTKDAVFSLLIGCISGVMVAGFYNPAFGLAQLFQAALGNADFIWVVMIEVVMEIMIANYLRADVISGVAKWGRQMVKSRRVAYGFGWIVALFVFFSDYFSPLFTGPIARPITDEYKVPREMLAYQLDSTSGPLCTITPISAWAVYMAGLLKGHGPIETADQGMALFIRSIPFNFYGLAAVIVCGLFAFQILPPFGPMKQAMRRADETGEVIRPGSTPLMGDEFNSIQPIPGKETHMVIHLVVPVLILITVAVGSFFIYGGVKILEAFISVVLYQSVVMAAGGYYRSIKDFIDTGTMGIKAVLPAIFILALAYCINTISKSLGAQQYVLELTRHWMTPAMLPAIIFAAGAAISFFTGTSWGTYALLVPFAIPIAFGLSGGEVNNLVVVTVAAIMGGGLFGDHCSPLSDTTCLSSFGASCDHMDHVATQLPYALAIALFCEVLFVICGVTML